MRIGALKGDIREWIFDEQKLKYEAIIFYTNLYGEHLGPIRGLPLSAFSYLREDDVQLLGKPITNEETKIALFDMTHLKASGSNRYHALFY